MCLNGFLFATYIYMELCPQFVADQKAARMDNLVIPQCAGWITT